MSTPDFQEWAEGISNQVVEMLVSREIFWKLRDIAQAKPTIDEPPLLTAWIADNYSYAQAVSVRRQTDNSEDARSLRRLLEELKGTALVTQSRKDVESDIESLETATSEVRKFVNKHLAHTDRRRQALSTHYETVHNAVDAIAAIAERYCTQLGCDHLRVTVEQWMDLEGDWLAPLRTPWLADAGDES